VRWSVDLLDDDERSLLETMAIFVDGWTIDAANPMGIMTVQPGIGGPEDGVGGHIRPADAPGVSIFVQVLDLDDTLRRAEAMGGRAVMQPFDVPGGPTVAQMADPEGNLVGLVKQ